MTQRSPDTPAADPGGRPSPAPGGEGPILCLLLGDDPETAVRLKRRAAETGRPIVFAAAGYDLRGGDAIDGAPVRAPMDYLTPADIDALYRDLYAWQAALPAQPMGGGLSLDAVSSPPGQAPAAIGWLLRFGAHLHLRLRFARLVAAMIAAERPSVLCPIGRSEAQPWAAALLGAIVRRADPAVAIAPPERLLSAQEAWDAALAREQRALAREQAIRAQGRETMRRLLKEREKRLQPLLERAGAQEMQSLDALITALAPREPSAEARPQPSAAASDGVADRLRVALAAAQSRLATLSAAHKEQRLGARRQQEKLAARLDAATRRARALEALTQRLSARLDAAQVRIARNAEARQRPAPRRKRVGNAAAAEAGAAIRSVWSVLRRWLGLAAPRR